MPESSGAAAACAVVGADTQGHADASGINYALYARRTVAGVSMERGRVPRVRPRARPDRVATNAVGTPSSSGSNPPDRSREMRVGVPREVKNREYRVALT